MDIEPIIMPFAVAIGEHFVLIAENRSRPHHACILMESLELHSVKRVYSLINRNSV